MVFFSPSALQPFTSPSPSRAPTGQDPYAQLGTPGRRHLHTEPLPQRHAALLLHATGQALVMARFGCPGKAGKNGGMMSSLSQFGPKIGQIWKNHEKNDDFRWIIWVFLAGYRLQKNASLCIDNKYTEACWWIVLKDVRHVEMLQKSWGWDDRWS